MYLLLWKTYLHCSIPRKSAPVRKSRMGFGLRMTLLEIDCQEQLNGLLDEDCCRGIRLCMDLPCSTQRTSCRSRTCTW